MNFRLKFAKFKQILYLFEIIRFKSISKRRLFHHLVIVATLLTYGLLNFMIAFFIAKAQIHTALKISSKAMQNCFKPSSSKNSQAFSSSSALKFLLSLA